MAESDASKTGTVDDLESLLEIDPDALREAEFAQAQAILDTMVGATIASASMEERGIVIEVTSGNRYFFYGFIGNVPSGPRDRPKES
jgi:hypothetical protein